MGRVCHGPSLLWAELSSYLPNELNTIGAECSEYNFISQSYGDTAFSP